MSFIGPFLDHVEVKPLELPARKNRGENGQFVFNRTAVRKVLPNQYYFLLITVNLDNVKKGSRLLTNGYRLGQ